MRKIILPVALFLAGALGAENVAEKAKYKRSEALNQIVYLDVPLRNFSSEKPELVKEFEEVKELNRTIH